jgi:predicted site-specific integrase-resolvase
MKSREVRKLLGISQPTLSKYARSGVIRYVRINALNYSYNSEDVYRLMGKMPSENDDRRNVSYSRVSLAKQKGDLQSQTHRLYEYAMSNGIVLSEQLEDIKSGMNFTDRRQFSYLLEEVTKGRIGTILVENRDRLCRFGFDLFEKFCSCHGTKIVVASEVENTSYEQELTTDLISIIHYFSMKSYSNRRKLNRIRKELQGSDED